MICAATFCLKLVSKHRHLRGLLYNIVLSDSGIGSLNDRHSSILQSECSLKSPKKCLPHAPSSEAVANSPHGSRLVVTSLFVVSKHQQQLGTEELYCPLS